MSKGLMQVERASDPIRIKHFEDQGGWSSGSTVDFLAHFTLILMLLKILVVHFHVDAVTAVSYPHSGLLSQSTGAFTTSKESVQTHVNFNKKFKRRKLRTLTNCTEKILVNLVDWWVDHSADIKSIFELSPALKVVRNILTIIHHPSRSFVKNCGSWAAWALFSSACRSRMRPNCCLRAAE